MSEKYLQSILESQIFNAPPNPLQRAITTITPTIQMWGNGYIDLVNPSGSYAKGTVVQGGSDLDLFISFPSNFDMSMKDIYNHMLSYMRQNGHPNAKAQNVSVGINIHGTKVDLVPAKRQNTINSDHTLFSKKTGTWIKTNIQKHIQIVSQSGCLREIRLMKLWRNQKNLMFPSFYLELSVITALKNNNFGRLQQNTITILEYLKNNITSARIIDPANSNNIISEDLSLREKALISQEASRTLSGSWEQFIS